MKMFPVDIHKFIMWWRFYSNVCVVNSSDYIRKTSSRFKLCFNVGLFNCIMGIWYTCWDADNSVPLGWHGSAQGRLAQSQSVGQLPLKCPSCLNPSVHITCGHKQGMAPRFVALQCRLQLCAQFQEDCPQNGWWASYHQVPANPLCPWTQAFFKLHYLQCLVILLKQPLFLIVCIAQLCTFIYYNSFQTSSLSVTKESTAVEMCVRQPWSWRDAPHISTGISLLIHLIIDVKKCLRHFFVRTHHLYMRPLELEEPRSGVLVAVQLPIDE